MVQAGEAGEACDGGEYVQCASYSSDRCSYTLCQSECGGWEEQSWYCI